MHASVSKWPASISMMRSVWSRNWLCLQSAVMYACAPEAMACGMNSPADPPHSATRVISSCPAGREIRKTCDENACLTRSASCSGESGASRLPTIPRPVAAPGDDGTSTSVSVSPNLPAILHETPPTAESMAVCEEYTVMSLRMAFANTRSGRSRPITHFTPRNSRG